MGLARARYLNGDPTKVVRNELSAAARHIETLFCDAFPLQNKTEVRALEGIMTALMVNDLDTARRISNTVHAGLSDAAAGEIPFEDRHHFLQALTHYLDGQRYEALESLQQSTRRYRTQCLSRMDTRTYYFTLHTALRGIVEGDANAFNTGLAAHL